MDDAVFFGRGQSHDDRRGDIEDFPSAKLLTFFEALAEIGAAHVLHGEVRHVVFLAHRVNLDDVGVDKLGRAARLAEKAVFHFLVLRGLRRQDLQGHFAIQTGLSRLEDLTHAADAQPDPDLKFAECFGEVVLVFAHGHLVAVARRRSASPADTSSNQNHFS